MLHSHSDVLKQLFPLSIGGVFEPDIKLEGAWLDAAAARAAVLKAEMFADSTDELIEYWERVYGLTPGAGDTLQIRRNRIVQKMRELGRLNLAYFTELAESLGLSIVIQELHPFMAGWSCAGDELLVDDADWCWRIYIIQGDPSAIDRFAALVMEMKPAYTHVEIVNL